MGPLTIIDRLFWGRCEVAPCYVFLSSDDSGYMTGQVFHPNGATIVDV